MHVVLGVNLPQLFQFDSTYMNSWSLQWAMFLRDMHIYSMSGISDITDKHPDGKEFKEPARLETVCKYYALITKLVVVEQITNLGGQRTQEASVTMDGACTFCGGPISRNTRDWKSIYKATSAIWTHLETCDRTTKCYGFGPGLTPEAIKPFVQYPVLIEARMSEEGLLSFDSILEESLVRCMECVMDNRVKCFESLVASWGPTSIQAENGYMTYSAEEGRKVPYNNAFNVPVLESIASGHIFDRTFAPPTENLEQVRKDNQKCLDLLAQWVSQFPEGYDSPKIIVPVEDERQDESSAHSKGGRLLYL